MVSWKDDMIKFTFRVQAAAYGHTHSANWPQSQPLPDRRSQEASPCCTGAPRGSRPRIPGFALAKIVD